MSHVTITDNAGDDAATDTTTDASTDVPPEADPATESHPEEEELSLVGSVYLHLLGEHGDQDGVNLDEQDAVLLHDMLHIQGENEIEHQVEDLRFRPGVALQNALFSTRVMAVKEVPVPVQAEPQHDDLPDEPEPAIEPEPEPADAEDPTDEVGPETVTDDEPADPPTPA